MEPRGAASRLRIEPRGSRVELKKLVRRRKQ
jgi:hypothetical protein